MTNRATVNISLTPELDPFLQSRVESGRYQSSSEVVGEALRLLEHQERDVDETLRQVKAELQLGVEQAERSELLEGDAVFDKLKTMIEDRIRVVTGQA